MQRCRRRNLSNTEIISEDIVLNGWILAGAALFSLATVYISCIQPCRVAASVTPIEAAKYTEGQTPDIRQGKHRRKHASKMKYITPRTLARQSIQRNKKRVVVVVASLVFGSLFQALVLRRVMEEAVAFQWHFTVTPILLCIPVIVLVVLLVPWAGFRRMYRISVGEDWQGTVSDGRAYDIQKKEAEKIL